MTILKCICGLLSPETVKIYSERGDLSKEDYLNRDIVYVSDEAIYFYINRLHLKEYIDYYPSALSKGTLQRMMLVMAFLRKKANLLLDEPFNGLDPIQIEEVIQICNMERKKDV